MTMASEVAYHQHHLSHDVYSSEHRTARRTPSVFPRKPSHGNQSSPVQNGSFRQRLERPQQHARASRNTAPQLQQLAPHSSYTSASENTEHMLRRKTPNGTLAAGYDGNPIEWTKRPHPMKHILVPLADDTRQPALAATTDPSHEQQSLRISPSLNPRFAMQGCTQQSNNYNSRAEIDSETDASDVKMLGFGWTDSDMAPMGLDSVLNQSSLHHHHHHHHYNLAGSHNVPTILQPMWPPSLEPTAIQNPAPYGPYWPDGAFEPYRPAPLRDPNYQMQATAYNAVAPCQSQPAADHYGQWLQTHSSPQYGWHNPTSSRTFHEHGREDLGPPMSGLNLSSRRNSLLKNYSPEAQDQNFKMPPSDVNKASVWKSQGSRNPNDICSDPYTTYPIQGREHSMENLQFKEKALTWAHRIYSNLLASIEEARRHSPHARQYTHNQPPRRPYPSWSNSHKRGHRSYDSLKSLAYTAQVGENCHTENEYQHRSHCVQHVTNESVTVASFLPTQLPTIASGQSRQRWQSRDEGRRAQHINPQPSYIPPHLAAERQITSPRASAAYAIEMLGRLCQESELKWIDGMLLTGCLAYGLGDFNKALKWYWKVLHQAPNNVEAMSNLAATLLALNRRDDAEQYWLRAVKLRPSYFEAIEHLIGLLHESHRGREAVKVIEYVEHALSVEDRDSTQKPRSESIDDYESDSYASSSANIPHRIVTVGFGSSGYAISPSDHGRMLALVHGKGNMLYQLGDNSGAAQAFEDAILIGAGRRDLGIQGLIRKALAVFSDKSCMASEHSHQLGGAHEPILLPPDVALETSRLVFPPQGRLPGLERIPDGFGQKAAVSIVSNSLLSLAKIYQDGMSSSGAAAAAPRAMSGVQEILALYYLSLSLQPSPSTANNVGILLASVQQSARSKSYLKSKSQQTSTIPGVVPGSGIALALAYYDYGLKLDTRHAHLYTNLGSLFKDIGQLNAAIKMYEKAVDCDGNFDIALANLANAVKDQGKVSDAIIYYKRAVQSNPDFAEAVCGLANALNSVCNWNGRGGINYSANNQDRWHVDENGDLNDSKKSLVANHGWIARVVNIVEKQLRDGENWGQGVLHSFGIEEMIQQLGISESFIGTKGQNSRLLKNTLSEWADKQWEGAKVVRLVERATKNLSQQIYRYQYIDKRPVPADLRTRPQLPTALAIPSAPTVLPFHTFTCPLSAKQIRNISQRNGLRVSCSTLRAPWLPVVVYDPPPPPSPHLNVGYISSDFNNHPLAHLMQSVFGFHDIGRVKAFCYATTASDGSAHRQQIEREAPVFHDASSWSIDRLVGKIVADGIHILVNLNGYTRGARNEVFAARPAPVQMSFMGFAGTLGAEWCDYLLADKTAIPPQTLRPWRNNVDLMDQSKDGNNDNNHDDWVYGENIIFTKDTFFCCDHKQSAPDSQEQFISWDEERQRRWQMRKELFPYLDSEAIILGNFNQLYKVRKISIKYPFVSGTTDIPRMT